MDDDAKLSLQIERVEALGEAAVDRGTKIAGLVPLPLIAPELREAGGGAEFPRLGLLLTCDGLGA